MTGQQYIDAEWRSRKKDTLDAGTYAHWLIECYLGKESPEPDVSLVAEERGQVAFGHWQHWWAGVGPTVEIVAIEEKLTSEHLLYGGTPDLVVRDKEGGLWVYDWKTSAEPKLRSKSVVQTAAYMYALLENGHEKPAGLRIVGIPTVDLGTMVDRSLPWDPVGVQAAALFASKRTAYQMAKDLDDLIGDY